MVQRLGRRGFLKLAGLLGVATVAKPLADMFDLDKDPKIQLEFVPFANYNPKGSASKSIDDTFSADAAKGLDPWIGRWVEPKSSPMISDYKQFAEAVLEDAKALGYDTAKIGNLSPRDAVYLSTVLTANKLNYRGTADIETTRESYREARREHENITRKVKELRQQLAEAKDETKIKQLEARINAWEILKRHETETIEKIEILSELTEAADPFAGLATASYDTLPADKIYLEQPEIVCRHYARVAAAVFSVLKNKSPLLANTYMVPHSTPALGHVWDQVTTLIEESGRTKAVIAFVDPTWYDGLKEKGLDAFDQKHMGEAFRYLKEQVDALKEKHKAPVDVKGL